MHGMFVGGLRIDWHPYFGDGPLAWRRANRERRQVAVLNLQTPFDVPQADTGIAPSLQAFRSRARAGVVNDERELAPAAGDAIDARANGHLAAAQLVCDAVLHGVLDQRLQQQRGNANVPQPHRHVYRDPEALLEPGVLDIEVRLEGLELASAG